jgi:hypothetical protein
LRIGKIESKRLREKKRESVKVKMRRVSVGRNGKFEWGWCKNIKGGVRRFEKRKKS